MISFSSSSSLPSVLVGYSGGFTEPRGFTARFLLENKIHDCEASLMKNTELKYKVDLQASEFLPAGPRISHGVISGQQL